MSEHEALQVLWDYMLMHHPLKPADVMVVLGSRESRVADWAAELYRRHLAEHVIITGGSTPQALESWGMSEARKFAEIMKQAGVPPEALWLDERALNTGENAKHAAEILEAQHLSPRSVLLVTKPYMERRAYATFKKWWPERDIRVSSPPIKLGAWIEGSERSEQETINILVGDVWRIKAYPARGFQIEQDIPAEVWEAHDRLAKLGYGHKVRPGPDTRPD